MRTAMFKTSTEFDDAPAAKLIEYLYSIGVDQVQLSYRRLHRDQAKSRKYTFEFASKVYIWLDLYKLRIAVREIWRENDMDRHSFTVERVDTETGVSGPVTFTRGEFAKAWIRDGIYDEGEIYGISHARKEAQIGSLWYDFGCFYKMVEGKPMDPRGEEVKLSRLIELSNRRNGGELTEADRVPETY